MAPAAAETPRPLPLAPLALAMMALAGLAGYFAYGIGRDVAGPAADAVTRPTAPAAAPAQRAPDVASRATVAVAVGSEASVATPAAQGQAGQPTVPAAAVAQSSPFTAATAQADAGNPAAGVSMAAGQGPAGSAAAPAGVSASAPAVAASAPPPAAVGASAPASAAASAAPSIVVGTGGTAQLSRAIKLGQPLKLAGTADTLVLLATNSTNQPLGFTARADIERGGAVIATAKGGLPALLPGQTRVLSLKSDNPLPTAFDRASLLVDSIADAPPDVAAGSIKLDAPKLTRPSPPTGEVVATNTGAMPRSFTVQAAFAQGDRLVGLVSAPVGSLQPGQSHTVALASPSSAAADAVHAVVESVRE